ncbi:MAG: hypothetical protein GX935_04910 [Erysipelotrichia bacterium]|nr:hypothetical protein [Erysipelotrichia bacterium]
MKKSYVVITSFSLMLLSIASFINQHYLICVVSFVLSILLLVALLFRLKEKISLNLLDLFIVAFQFVLIGFFINQLKEISVAHVYIGLIITLFNLIYHKTISTLNLNDQKYCYIISITMLSFVFAFVALVDFVMIIIFSMEGSLVFNYLIFLFVISFPTLIMGLSNILHPQSLKA